MTFSSDSGSHADATTGVLLSSPRDRRTLDWLILQAGEEAVARACGQLRGARLPLPSNVAKALGLKPPDSLMQPSLEEVKANVAAIKSRLRQHR